jgi:transcription initiation factor TFIID subunit 1
LYRKRPDGKIIDRYNISEDWRYETYKVKASRFKHAKGTATLVHALPAIMLHPFYYKPIQTVNELRSHHRPSLKFPLNETFTFSRVKAIKKSKLKNIDPSASMKSPKDLSLKDTCKFILMEYTEEYPLIMQNIGMASLIYNYYRKKDEKDSFVPKVFIFFKII